MPRSSPSRFSSFLPLQEQSLETGSGSRLQLRVDTNFLLLLMEFLVTNLPSPTGKLLSLRSELLLFSLTNLKIISK
jgi:hypothetical protein